jgi:hypothetical protein
MYSDAVVRRFDISRRDKILIVTVQLLNKFDEGAGVTSTVTGYHHGRS